MSDKLLHLLSAIMTFGDHDVDCHINNWGDNQIPECTCGYTSVSRDCLDALESTKLRSEDGWIRSSHLWPPIDGTRFDVWAKSGYRHTNIEWYEPQKQFVDSLSAMEVEFEYWRHVPKPPTSKVGE